MSEVSMWAYSKMGKKPKKPLELKGYSVRLDPHDQYLLDRLLAFFDSSVTQNEILSRAIYTGLEEMIRELALHDEGMKSLYLNDMKSPDYRFLESENPHLSRDEILGILQQEKALFDHERYELEQEQFELMQESAAMGVKR
jgi:hypothetical protein